jgi:hypothetical protein
MTKSDYDNLLGWVYALESELPTLTQLTSLVGQTGSASPVQLLSKWSFFSGLKPTDNVATLQKLRDEKYLEILTWLPEGSFVADLIWGKLFMPPIRRAARQAFLTVTNLDQFLKEVGNQVPELNRLESILRAHSEGYPESKAGLVELETWLDEAHLRMMAAHYPSLTPTLRAYLLLLVDAQFKQTAWRGKDLEQSALAGITFFESLGSAGENSGELGDLSSPEGMADSLISHLPGGTEFGLLQDSITTPFVKDGDSVALEQWLFDRQQNFLEQAHFLSDQGLLIVRLVWLLDVLTEQAAILLVKSHDRSGGKE